jgi:hypothetical protein
VAVHHLAAAIRVLVRQVAVAEPLAEMVATEMLTAVQAEAVLETTATAM